MRTYKSVQIINKFVFFNSKVFSNVKVLLKKLYDTRFLLNAQQRCHIFFKTLITPFIFIDLNLQNNR
jgi:hypothetical protein